MSLSSIVRKKHGANAVDFGTVTSINETVFKFGADPDNFSWFSSSRKYVVRYLPFSTTLKLHKLIFHVA